MEKTSFRIEAYPCQIFSALYHEPGAIFLESQRPSFTDRYSYIAWKPEKIFKGHITNLNKDDFFTFISSHSQEYFVAGYIGYETCQWIEDLPSPGSKDTPNPDIYLAAYPQFFVFDHIQKTWSCWHKDTPLSLPKSQRKKREGGSSKTIGFNQSTRLTLSR